MNMESSKIGKRAESKYSHCQINYTSANFAFILPSRKAINRFVNQAPHHSGENHQGNHSTSLSSSPARTYFQRKKGVETKQSSVSKKKNRQKTKTKQTKTNIKVRKVNSFKRND